VGTRNLTVVIKNNEPVVAQYGQWDGYPEGQGITALNAIRNNLNEIIANLPLCKFKTEDELQMLTKPYVNEDGMMSLDSSNLLEQEIPSISRNTGANILNIIANATSEIPLWNDYDFKNDELFCEGYYELNLDTNEFISKWSGKTVRFSLNTIPSDGTYLELWQYALDNVTV
jgi:hypothetical protein